ncbi:aminotransferase class IV [Dysgonomonas macrotermitis]|uniref:4-amino-4-deoxychorismate lyase n=1 Tax=Dysgonomonas macrotermitis TaxID=1346286 RepID=A0A1M4TI95_9BACT|nr:aminotransferase class IV [Dysgonomonas macrotermitis]SHE44054.1 4-amino-4-deoxychorismate lyase [Dysgonomonas macrotermitis]
MKKPQFIETIRVENGRFCLLQFHVERANNTCKVYFSKTLDIDLKDCIIPENMRSGIVKCRIIYSDRIESISFEPYTFKCIKQLALIHDNTISYNYKSSDRSQLQHLLSMKLSCDDILIVKNGYITDTSYTNVVFENKDGLFTPSTPLLSGVQRRFLLENGIIKEKSISVTELNEYTHIYLINAMIRLEDSIKLGTNNIIPVNHTNQ